MICKAAPQLISHTKKRSLTTHAELDLHCSFSGYPPPVVTWTKDNETITITSRFILEDFEGTINGRLFVSDVVQGDHGVYTCEASSEEFPGQEVSADISVSIKGKSSTAKIKAHHASAPM